MRALRLDRTLIAAMSDIMIELTTFSKLLYQCRRWQAPQISTRAHAHGMKALGSGFANTMKALDGKGANKRIGIGWWDNCDTIGFVDIRGNLGQHLIK